MTTPLPLVTAASYLTLHYRLACEGGGNMLSTFDDKPATLLLGQGQLAPFLEQRLLGLAEGAHQSFTLSAEEAFGARNPELLQSLSRAMFDANTKPDQDYEVGDLIELAGPNGGRFIGILQEIDDASALVDFNHPLAGQAVTFEVKILSVL
jgi:FKBP-type peptidyl-prolyl cis-trans isomerase SlpA